MTILLFVLLVFSAFGAWDIWRRYVQALRDDVERARAEADLWEARYWRLAEERDAGDALILEAP